jgi:2-methylcitrate dehydratase PrpD
MPDLASENTDVARRIADWAVTLDPSDIPEEVANHAKLCLLDGFGTALAGVRKEHAQVTLRAIHGLAAGGEYPVIGTDHAFGPRDAAFANGYLVHALDFDDTHSTAVTHTTASALPIMLTAGLQSGADGRDALTAFVLATEVSARIGAAARGRFHERGFHPTAVAGTFGATVAAGRLTGLATEQIAEAQGIVLSMAGGSFAFLENGAWTKRLHPGWACVSALTAVALAREGFRGAARPYDGRFGLYALYASDGARIDPDEVFSDLGLGWEVRNVAFKPIPACHLTHAFSDAAIALRAAHALRPGDIARIEARAAPGIQPIVCDPIAEKRRPQSDYDAQFSLPYIVAASLARGRFTLDELEADTLKDPEILALCDRVICVDDPESAYPQAYSGMLRIELADGRVLEHREQVHRGAAANPISPADIEGKFYANATRTLDRDAATRVIEAVMTLDQARSLARLAGAVTR